MPSLIYIYIQLYDVIDNNISHKVSGTQGAVSVENEQCSNVGLNGTYLKNEIYSISKLTITICSSKGWW